LSGTKLRTVVAVLACALGAAGPLAASAGASDTFIQAEVAKKKKKSCKKKKKKKSRAAAKCKKPGASGPTDLSDADGDGLPHDWETKGTPSGVPLQSYGADPNRKDIFVQLDYTSASLRDAVPCGELDMVVDAFANAPVSNPNGTSGVNLHLDAGKSCPGRNYNLGGSKLFSAPDCGTAGDVFNGDPIAESRARSFHIAGVGYCGSTYGAATLNGTMMAIFVPGAGIAHLLMHELGHNLGLDHPIVDQLGIQPNRLSDMSTQLQTSSTGSTATEVVDYQRVHIPALDESSVNEETGIQVPEAHNFFITHICPPGAGHSGITSEWPGDGPTDWNCSTTGFINPLNPPDIQHTPVPADLNGDGDTNDFFPATDPEWPVLDYRSGGHIGP
jgi:hypothetical protein